MHFCILEIILHIQQYLLLISQNQTWDHQEFEVCSPYDEVSEEFPISWHAPAIQGPISFLTTHVRRQISGSRLSLAACDSKTALVHIGYPFHLKDAISAAFVGGSSKLQN